MDYRNLEFDEFVQVFNIEGKIATREFVANNTNVKHNYFIKLLRKHTKYTFNRIFKKYKFSNDDLDILLSMDNLINKSKEDPTTHVASVPEKI